MKVGDVMTRHARTCQPGQSAEAVMRTLWERDLGALPVVNERGEPIAVITDRDIAVAAYTQGKSLGQITVQSAMSRAVHTAHISDSLASAERTMRTHQVRRLPVIDESTRLVGVLSLSDLVRSRSASEPAAPGRGTDVLQTLAAISTPRRAAPSDPSPAREPLREREATAEPKAPEAAADPKAREASPEPKGTPATSTRQKPSTAPGPGQSTPAPAAPRAARGRQR